MHRYKIGDKVYFGRPNGEKTLGEIVKLNPTKAKVRTLEERGSRRAVGVEWSVPYLYITRAEEHSVVPAPLLRTEEDWPVYGEDVHIMRAIASIYGSLSPEILSCDGELSASESYRRRRVLDTKLNHLFQAIGRRVTETEAISWSELQSYSEKQFTDTIGLSPFP